MSQTSDGPVAAVCQAYGNDRTRLLDIVLDVRTQEGCVGSDAIDVIATCLSMPRVDVEGVVSFYAFLDTKPEGQIAIGMSDQAPAALVNDVVVPRLGPGTAVRGVRLLKMIDAAEDLNRILVPSYGDGNNSHDLVRAAVENNLRRRGEVIFAGGATGVGLRTASRPG